jgi:hypothetical protein
VASLGTGTVARWGPNGEALYSVRNAARILRWSQTGVRTAVAEGERFAASRLLGAVTGTVNPAGTRTAEMTGNERGSDAGRGPRRRDPHTGTGTGARNRPGNRDGTDGTWTNVGGLSGHDRDGHLGWDARHGKDRERTGQRSRPGLGRGYPRNVIGTDAHCGPGRDREPS